MFLEKLYFPHDISTFGPSIDAIFLLIFWITMVTWVLVTVTMVVFLVKYRARPGRKAEYIEGNSKLEITWTTATTVILVALALLSRSTWADIKENGPPGDFFYKVTANQFNWEITYPGPDGKIDTKDDVTIENEFHVPVNKVIRIELESKDVIHSFFVPDFRIHMDALPGRYTSVWFQATRPGSYHLFCSQYCATNHAGMVGRVIVQ